MTLTELHGLAVGNVKFSLSSTRGHLMRSLWTLTACLCRWNVGEELWIDGSFLTEKINPRDVDLVLILPEGFENEASEEQLGIWDWWDDPKNEPKSMFGCDTFSVPKIAAGEPDHHHYLTNEMYWKRFFGTSRTGEKKGMGRILLPGGCI